ncbi:prolipoprotein diacylglyceryl transferase [Demequina lutea]|uniref:Phosphatidylglycerol:prolipoprotein diacylglycerol transferase n=1 Tax=Demequina lutea TaxID=431489 RepID=A0A7Y9Z7L4_9MICO|nr:prolipoprotein diacylglyceryl transferase family protein [Demequina lutea]NYI40312.1 phosphatidylglycerol:prolipoprotein diacylglycerol transferase [Demequina lutea]
MLTNTTTAAARSTSGSHLSPPKRRSLWTVVTGALRIGPVLARLSGASTKASPLEFVAFDWSVLASVEPQDVALTYWFDVDENWDTYGVAVKFTGRRIDVKGKPESGDAFRVATGIDGLKRGMGRVALTHRVSDANPGRWKVDAAAEAIPQNAKHRNRPVTPHRLSSAVATGTSVYAPVARQRAPGIILGAWPALVGLGALAGVALQSTLARAVGLPVTRVLLLALASCLVGIVGAKVYYRLTHLGEKTGLLVTGASLQGFVIGAITVLALGSALWRLPVGTVLDVTAPALLLGQAIGRIGCFFGGCCTGLPTTSRWGLWSSDRRIGVKRVPVQLMESASAAVLAVSSVAILRFAAPLPQGLVFVGGLSAYLVVRQLLFPLRGLPRKTAHGRIITLAVASAALVGAAFTAFLN